MPVVVLKSQPPLLPRFSFSETCPSMLLKMKLDLVCLFWLIIAFGEYGTVISCRFPTDKETGAFKGFGYLEFNTLDEATAAVDGLNGQSISGRSIRLDYSQPRDDAGGARQGGGGFGGRGGLF